MLRENDDLEKLRAAFKPSKIVLLLVGESPPPHRGFFYDPTVAEGQLSRNTRKTFQDHFLVEYADRQEFLKRFQTKGCYLFDLFKQRGKTFATTTKQERNAAVEELGNFLQEEQPRLVASTLRRISGLVEEAVKTSQLTVEYRTLPYPTRQYIPEYRSKLGLILSELSSENIPKRTHSTIHNRIPLCDKSRTLL